MLAHLGLLATMLAWGSMIPVLYVLLERWDPFTLSAVRYVLGAPIMLGLAWLRDGPLPRPVGRQWTQLGLLGGIGIAGLSTLYTLGLAHAHPLPAIVIQSASPLTTTLVGWALFRIPPGRGMVVAFLLAVAGGLLVSWPGPRAARAGLGLRGGELLLLVATSCWAWYSVACQRWLAGLGQLQITALTFVPGALALILVNLAAWAAGLTRAPRLWDAPGDVAALLWLTITATCLGVAFWNYGVSRLGLPVASLYLNTVPVFAVLLSATLGVVPTPLQVLGGLLVLAGVAQAQLRKRG